MKVLYYITLCEGLFRKTLITKTVHVHPQTKQFLQKPSRGMISSILRLGAKNLSGKLPRVRFQLLSVLQQTIAPGWFQDAVFKHFQTRSNKLQQITPGSFQDTVFNHFQAQSKNRSRNLPGTCFPLFPKSTQKIDSGVFQGVTFNYLQPWSKKNWRRSGGSFQACSGSTQKVATGGSRKPLPSMLRFRAENRFEKPLGTRVQSCLLSKQKTLQQVSRRPSSRFFRLEAINCFRGLP